MATQAQIRTGWIAGLVVATGVACGTSTPSVGGDDAPGPDDEWQWYGWRPILRWRWWRERRRRGIERKARLAAPAAVALRPIRICHAL